MKVIELGEISGNVVLNLTALRAPYFVGTLVGNCVFAFKRRASGLFCLDLTQGGAGGFTVAFNGAGGKPVVDPSGGQFTQQFYVDTPGARSVGQWADARLWVTAMGFVCTPA